MPALDSQIDELYRSPVGEFVSARNALAKTLTGDAARLVKALRKPAAAPFAVNQLYWRARPVYERLVKAGAALRAAQVAELKGRKADVRKAIDAHRHALTAAITDAHRLAAAQSVHVEQNVLTQMLEAVSLAAKLPEPPGRLTMLLRPAGFEALAGVPVVATPRASEAGAEHDAARDKRAKEIARQRLREAAQAEQQRAAALRQAERAVEKARALEARTREAWEDAKAGLEKAERKLERARA